MKLPDSLKYWDTHETCVTVNEVGLRKMLAEVERLRSEVDDLKSIEAHDVPTVYFLEQQITTLREALEEIAVCVATFPQGESEPCEELNHHMRVTASKALAITSTAESESSDPPTAP